jgi:hypothetical protein
LWSKRFPREYIKPRLRLVQRRAEFGDALAGGNWRGKICGGGFVEGKTTRSSSPSPGRPASDRRKAGKFAAANVQIVFMFSMTS